MRALTLWRPWDQAILRAGKDIENSPWRLWESQIGQPIALHAGKRYDTEGAEWMRSNNLYDPPRDEECPLGIVGIVVFSAATGFSDSRWFQGPFGWVIADVKTLEVPISIKGKQGLWVVPEDALLEIDRQLGKLS